jgi:hypothetical protein
MATAEQVGSAAGHVPRSFTVDLPEELAERLAESSEATGYELGEILSISLQMFLEIDRARRAGGTVTVRTPDRPELTFTLDPYDGRPK